MTKIKTIKFWLQIKSEYENSGLSISEFCEIKDIKRATFYRNMSLLKEIGSITSIKQNNQLITIIVNGNQLEINLDLEDETIGRMVKLCAK